VPPLPPMARTAKTANATTELTAATPAATIATRTPKRRGQPTPGIMPLTRQSAPPDRAAIAALPKWVGRSRRAPDDRRETAGSPLRQPSHRGQETTGPGQEQPPGPVRPAPPLSPPAVPGARESFGDVGMARPVDATCAEAGTYDARARPRRWVRSSRRPPARRSSSAARWAIRSSSVMSSHRVERRLPVRRSAGPPDRPRGLELAQLGEDPAIAKLGVR
jgi:hypothetical protein